MNLTFAVKTSFQKLVNPVGDAGRLPKDTDETNTGDAGVIDNQFKVDCF